MDHFSAFSREKAELGISSDRFPEKQALGVSQEFYRHGTFHRTHVHPSSLGPLGTRSNEILLICDDAKVCGILNHFLSSEGYATVERSFDDLGKLMEGHFMVVLVDMGTPNTSPDYLFSMLDRIVPEIPVIVMDEANRSHDHKEYCRARAYSYLVKPTNRTDLLRDLKQATKNAELLYENRMFRQSIGIPVYSSDFYGHSHEHEMFAKRVESYARLEAPVLIVGEKGTGKEIAAQHLHLASARGRAPFIMIECHSLSGQGLEHFLFGCHSGTLAEFSMARIGALEMADHGTVYLANIQELPLLIQKRICLFIKDKMINREAGNAAKTVNTRIVAGSPVDLSQLCMRGEFDEELYYRLSSMTINLNPLRDQVADIPAYAKSLLIRFAREYQVRLPIFSITAIEKMQKHAWPENFRELKRVIRRAILNAKDTIINENEIIFDSLEEIRNGDRPLGLAGMTMLEIERRAIIETIQACGGNRAESARQLGVSEKTIYNKFRQFKLKGVV